jgi:Zn-dependent peptidase ImmA (M78 family)
MDKNGKPKKRKDDFASVICCQRNYIECFNFSNKRTPADWREHQADYYAAAIAMPNKTFKPPVNQFLRENGIYKGHIRIGCCSDLDILADDLLPDYISETYGVSKRAARIKLRKCGFVSEININSIIV